MINLPGNEKAILIKLSTIVDHSFSIGGNPPQFQE